jgi:hypothetical protein
MEEKWLKWMEEMSRRRISKSQESRKRGGRWLRGEMEGVLKEMIRG